MANEKKAGKAGNLVGLFWRGGLYRSQRDHGIKRFVHTSTSEVYGTAQQVPISELP